MSLDFVVQFLWSPHFAVNLAYHNRIMFFTRQKKLHPSQVPPRALKKREDSETGWQTHPYLKKLLLTRFSQKSTRCFYWLHGGTNPCNRRCAIFDCVSFVLKYV